jgi:hypothetical protein
MNPLLASSIWVRDIDSQFTIDSIIIAVRRSGVDVTIRVRDLSPPGEEVEA